MADSRSDTPAGDAGLPAVADKRGAGYMGCGEVIVLPGSKAPPGRARMAGLS